ncbi:water stress protein WSP1 [Nostoc sp. ChiSLP03a]|uniref:water stress protein WSP1 n=1 Tax=Nostoc sp. ChiSLP03a TaxID=3075380 RepID=UPI002AD3A971|nr:water stress protein WSP1 [Nostoc sp. ChiSLP03a]MDZ8212884.1 water stress protein WSP1 [Nostoc sp. ChiSLP03a]
MALYGYTIGEDRDSNASNGKQLDVYRFLIPSGPGGSITPTRVGTVNLPATATTADLEGLGTNPRTGRVGAVNEARVTGATTPIDPTVTVVNNVDQPFAPATTSPTRTPSDLRRFGFESGADFGRDYSVAAQPIVLYNISGNPNPANGPVGSSLYKITTATPGTVSLVDGFGAPTTTAQRQGTQPTNPGKFADGLAIDNLNPGRTRALASDFRTNDGDGNQLYKVDVLTGELSAPITLRTPSGQALNVNADSGLSFTNFGSQRLLGWLETGAVYEITGYQDELAASGLGLGSATGTNGAGFATATLLGNVNLPNAVSGVVDYEGFTIVNE